MTTSTTMVSLAKQMDFPLNSYTRRFPGLSSLHGSNALSSPKWKFALHRYHTQLYAVSLRDGINKKNLSIRATLNPTLNPDEGGYPKIIKGVKLLLGASSPPLSDVVWSALGAFLGMAGFAYADHFLASKGLSMTMGSFAALSVLLFAAPKSPASQKWNVYVAQVGCAFLSVSALVLFGVGWFSRCIAVASCVAFMLFSNSVNPPAAGLPLIFIDAPKFQHLQWWYVVFPGLLGCVYLFFLQGIINLLKDRVKF